MVVDTSLSSDNIKQLSLSISITDVLDTIKKDYKNYLDFLKNEYENNKISKTEYEQEKIILQELINSERKEMIII